MLMQEAEVVYELIQLGISKISHTANILNIGSSTSQFRNIVQPHISRLIFHPLEMQGHRIIHVDLKKDDGVDFCGDITDPVFRERLHSLNPDLIMCCNILEHVADLSEFCSSLDKLGRGTPLLITCPRNYPYHPDPIDNGFRPDASEIANKFPNHILVAQGHAIGEKLKERFRAWSLMQKSKFILATIKGAMLAAYCRNLSDAKKSMPNILSFWNSPFTATVALLEPRLNCLTSGQID